MTRRKSPDSEEAVRGALQELAQQVHVGTIAERLGIDVVELRACLAGGPVPTGTAEAIAQRRAHR